VTYSSAEEAAEKIRYYLEHEDERASIAAAGHARTLAEHTYAHRMRELEQILNRNAK
jgi:spore maturation protein CgeB